MSRSTFEGKRVLVTGGTRGIGAQIVKDLWRYGADVHYTGRMSTFAIKYGEFHEVDFLDDEEFYSFFEKIGHLHFDILINCAGVNKIEHIEELEPWKFEDVIKINTTRPFELIGAISMGGPKIGRIVNISSISGTFGQKGRTAYCASKHALNAITKTAALDLAERNILVNSVSPGPIMTDMTKKALKKDPSLSKIENQIPLKRFGDVEEVSKLVLFLVGDSNTYITGQDFVIDGGLTCSWRNSE